MRGRIRNGFLPQALSQVGRKLVDRTTHAKNDRAMATTPVEFSNPRDTTNGLRRVFIHRFRVVNAIADVISPFHSLRFLPHPAGPECRGDLLGRPT